MGLITNIYHNLKRHQFLFEELVKRDFKQKYKRTVLGMLWSILSPLLTMLILLLVFGNVFGREIPHFTIYLLIGNIMFSYYREATTTSMGALLSNANIFTKINIPKYLFLLSKNISSLINFGLSLLILFIFILCDGLPLGLNYLMLFIPIICFVGFNIGVGLILSAWNVFYRDIAYLYSVLTMLVMYGSAIFYDISIVPEKYRCIFYFNPVWIYINYFRSIVIYDSIPSIEYHLLCLGYACLFIVIGSWIYKKYNHKFLYYI